MTRDMELIRELLLKLESISTASAVFHIKPDDEEVAVEGYSPDQIEYHLDLLRERDLIECPGSQPMIGITYRRLTWEGHDFLDAVRDPEIWHKTKKGAVAMGSFTFDLVKELAKGLIKKKIEDHTGVKL
jgi:hypothetical protein